ncbi:MAG: hypothetical protein HY960_10025 [Ignavibacteriae bacterium]|nr:hypothetical protein [Ignavibacteriota bacterium]
MDFTITDLFFRIKTSKQSLMSKLQHYWYASDTRRVSGCFEGDGCGTCLTDFGIEGTEQTPLPCWKKHVKYNLNSNHQFINSYQ